MFSVDNFDKYLCRKTACCPANICLFKVNNRKHYRKV